MKCVFQKEGDADMTKMRFSCPLCGAGQEADNMNEGVFCPYCGAYIDIHDILADRVWIKEIPHQA